MDLILVVALVVIVALAVLGVTGFWIDAGADRQEGL
jgi:hypothetical protein